jgi:uncharacterized glyoxalase superfamily protein PhnB
MTESTIEPLNSLDAESLAASLTVRELSASLAFYRDVLGFQVEQEHVREGVLRAVSVRAGAVRILLGQDNGAKGWDRVKGEGFSLMLTTRQDVDALAAGIVERGGELETAPTQMPWGARLLRVRDPDGFLLAISTPR